MDADEAKETATDGAASETVSMTLDVPSVHEPMQRIKKQPKRKRALVDEEASSAGFQGEIGALFDYYKEVSGYQLKPEEIGCTTNDSIIACLLEESNLPYAKLVDEIYRRMELRDGVTKSLVRSSVDHIGERMSYGISDIHDQVLVDESKSKLWCWETRDLELLPPQLHGSLQIRRMARKLIHERILAISGTPKVHVNENTGSVSAIQDVLNLDGIRSLVEKLKSDMAQKDSKTTERSNLKALKEQTRIDCQVQKEQKHKERELKHIKEKADKEAKRAERQKAEQNKRLKKHQEAEREQKRTEKQQAELKRQACIQKQANFMENFLRGRKAGSMESPGNHHSVGSPHSNVISKIEDCVSSATSAMDCTLSAENQLRLDEIWKLQIAGWRKLSRQKKICRWGVRRNPKIELCKELKLQKCAATASSEFMSTLIKEQSSQMERPGSLNFSKLLDESYGENGDTSETTNANTPSSVCLVRKLLQFDRSYRPAYYGTWRKKSSAVCARYPFKMDPLLDYDVDSDEEWEEEEPGENLSDFDNDDEEAMDEQDSKHDAEEETDNSFVVPNDYLSEDEGVQFESGKLDDTCRLLIIPGVAIEELNVVLRQQKALHSFTKHALDRDRPLVIYNLDHGKADLLDAEDMNGIFRVEQLCLQALCMREYPGAPIIDIPVNITLTTEDQEIGQPKKKGPSTPVASKLIPDSDLPKVVKLISSCPYGISKLVESLHMQFPRVPKFQLKNKIREIADFTNNRWQVKKEILDWCGSSVPLDKGVQEMQTNESGDSVQHSPQSDAKLKIHKHQIDAQGSGGSTSPSDHEN
ncbi:chromatin assembly factor 1 subunit FSM-like isoform X2 [Oryza brachyantha]|nr:chromatin assembly factor 1 subunit FSM-like isoform X2 [Oryza brachyantha]XP_015694495.1 chromatin assembly factor 1 subunit FSM-like isoform X2 [Oryza brachyantha]XP_015694496.1 chromatin assembly factor 1 subunit FSM-like isoform X2 [Oryza brachyantha]